MQRAINTERKETALYEVYVFNDAIPRGIMARHTDELASFGSHVWWCEKKAVQTTNK
jgi:hypothetical protein